MDSLQKLNATKQEQSNVNSVIYGSISNCLVGVYWSFATPSEHLVKPLCLFGLFFHEESCTKRVKDNDLG